MKNVIAITVCLLFCSMSISQVTGLGCTKDDRCEDPARFPHENYSKSVDPAYLATFEPVVYNIFFWGINKDPGSIGVPTITEDAVLANIAQINKEFNQFNIFFKYAGFDNTSFNSTDQYSGPGANLAAILSYASGHNLIKTDAFNVYVPKRMSIGSAEAGYAGRNMAIAENQVNGLTSTLLHELGHNFNLLHTENCYLCHEKCEHVTRNSGDLNYNADSAGDYVVDTPAMPLFELNDFNPLTCEYGGDPSCEGIPYELTLYDITNYMSNGPIECGQNPTRDHFTIGQQIRMRETIVLDEATHPASGQIIKKAKTTIASLYEPYKGEYELGGAVIDVPLFQPGFDYQFIECSCDNLDEGCDLPLPYNDLTFDNLHTVIKVVDADETNYTNINHPNHTAILIEQLDDPETRRCWDNDSEGLVGAMIITFKDEIFNTNVTKRMLEMEEIKNTDIILNLDKGLYKIEWYYEDGSRTEQVIYKKGI